MNLCLIITIVICASFANCYSPFLSNKQRFGQFRSNSFNQWAQPSGVSQLFDTNATLQGGISTNAFETMLVLCLEI